MYGSRCAAITDSKPVTLAWLASPDPSVAGYAVYYGAVSGNYTSRIDLGTNTAASVPGLAPGANYFFVVVAYDANHVESTPSNEILVNPPVPLHMTMGTTPLSPVTLNFSGAPGHWYELQATSDLKNWATIWQFPIATDFGWLQYQDFPLGQSYTQRFYRLVVH